MLQVRSLQFQYHSKTVFSSISFNLKKGQVLALTGANGSGKTTLLKCVAGDLAPSSGSIQLDKRFSIAWLRQIVPNPDQSLLEFLFSDYPEIQKSYRDMQKEKSSSLKYAEALGDYAALGGYELERKMLDHLRKYGWDETDLERTLKTFSDGQKQILSLIRILLQDADLYLLDEPTNHLDINRCRQLEEMMLKEKVRGKTFIVVSHDRTFIDRVADQTLYLKQGKNIIIEGGYTECLRHIEHQFQVQLAHAEEIQRRIKSLELESRRKQCWAGRKEKEKQGAMDKGFIGKRAAKLAKKAKIAERRQEQLLENLKEEKPLVEKRINLSIKPYEIISRPVVTAKNISKSYRGSMLFESLNIELHTHQKVIMIGPNGSGKSTLMRCLIGEMSQDQGNIERNPSAKWIYLPQDIHSFFKNDVLLDNFKKLGINEPIIRQFLGGAKLREEQVFQKIKNLSPGELMRAAIVWCILYQAEFLFLDEPTNHLDIESLQVLDQLLEQYPGGFFCISHDRQFIATHAEEVFLLEDKKIHCCIL